MDGWTPSLTPPIHFVLSFSFSLSFYSSFIVSIFSSLIHYSFPSSCPYFSRPIYLIHFIRFCLLTCSLLVFASNIRPHPNSPFHPLFLPRLFFVISPSPSTIFNQFSLSLSSLSFSCPLSPFPVPLIPFHVPSHSRPPRVSPCLQDASCPSGNTGRVEAMLTPIIRVSVRSCACFTRCNFLFCLRRLHSASVLVIGDVRCLLRIRGRGVSRENPTRLICDFSVCQSGRVTA